MDTVSDTVSDTIWRIVMVQNATIGHFYLDTIRS